MLAPPPETVSPVFDTVTPPPTVSPPAVIVVAPVASTLKTDVDPTLESMNKNPAFVYKQEPASIGRGHIKHCLRQSSECVLQRERGRIGGFGNGSSSVSHREATSGNSESPGCDGCPTSTDLESSGCDGGQAGCVHLEDGSGRGRQLGIDKQEAGAVRVRGVQGEHRVGQGCGRIGQRERGRIGGFGNGSSSVSHRDATSGHSESPGCDGCPTSTDLESSGCDGGQAGCVHLEDGSGRGRQLGIDKQEAGAVRVRGVQGEHRVGQGGGRIGQRERGRIGGFGNGSSSVSHREATSGHSESPGCDGCPTTYNAQASCCDGGQTGCVHLEDGSGRGRQLGIDKQEAGAVRVRGVQGEHRVGQGGGRIGQRERGRVGGFGNGSSSVSHRETTSGHSESPGCDGCPTTYNAQASCCDGCPTSTDLESSGCDGGQAGCVHLEDGSGRGRQLGIDKQEAGAVRVRGVQGEHRVGQGGGRIGQRERGRVGGFGNGSSSVSHRETTSGHSESPGCDGCPTTYNAQASCCDGGQTGCVHLEDGSGRGRQLGIDKQEAGAVRVRGVQGEHRAGQGGGRIGQRERGRIGGFGNGSSSVSHREATSGHSESPGCDGCPTTYNAQASCCDGCPTSTDLESSGCDGGQAGCVHLEDGSGRGRQLGIDKQEAGAVRVRGVQGEHRAGQGGGRIGQRERGRVGGFGNGSSSVSHREATSGHSESPGCDGCPTSTDLESSGCDGGQAGCVHLEDGSGRGRQLGIDKQEAGAVRVRGVQGEHRVGQGGGRIGQRERGRIGGFGNGSSSVSHRETTSGHSESPGCDGCPTSTDLESSGCDGGQAGCVHLEDGSGRGRQLGIDKQEAGAVRVRGVQGEHRVGQGGGRIGQRERGRIGGFGNGSSSVSHREATSGHKAGAVRVRGVQGEHRVGQGGGRIGQRERGRVGGFGNGSSSVSHREATSGHSESPGCDGCPTSTDLESSGCDGGQAGCVHLEDGSGRGRQLGIDKQEAGAVRVRGVQGEHRVGQGGGRIGQRERGRIGGFGNGSSSVSHRDATSGHSESPGCDGCPTSTDFESSGCDGGQAGCVHLEDGSGRGRQLGIDKQEAGAVRVRGVQGEHRVGQDGGRIGQRERGRIGGFGNGSSSVSHRETTSGHSESPGCDGCPTAYNAQASCCDGGQTGCVHLEDGSGRGRQLGIDKQEAGAVRVRGVQGEHRVGQGGGRIGQRERGRIGGFGNGSSSVSHREATSGHSESPGCDGCPTTVTTSTDLESSGCDGGQAGCVHLEDGSGRGRQLGIDKQEAGAVRVRGVQGEHRVGQGGGRIGQRERGRIGGFGNGSSSVSHREATSGHSESPGCDGCPTTYNAQASCCDGCPTSTDLESSGCDGGQAGCVHLEDGSGRGRQLGIDKQEAGAVRVRGVQGEHRAGQGGGRIGQRERGRVGGFGNGSSSVSHREATSGHSESPGCDGCPTSTDLESSGCDGGQTGCVHLEDGSGRGRQLGIDKQEAGAVRVRGVQGEHRVGQDGGRIGQRERGRIGGFGNGSSSVSHREATSGHSESPGCDGCPTSTDLESSGCDGGQAGCVHLEDGSRRGRQLGIDKQEAGAVRVRGVQGEHRAGQGGGRIGQRERGRVGGFGNGSSSVSHRETTSGHSESPGCDGCPTTYNAQASCCDGCPTSTDLESSGCDGGQAGCVHLEDGSGRGRQLGIDKQEAGAVRVCGVQGASTVLGWALWPNWSA
ncbi:hypothetical protein GN958_ATG02354 [Phytophthora infestans]|uniref:Uncharacterized protein n=1 Tax=Phytophthora infestans TaxID=4787 RepID=A0A8S9V7H3_PHYIN|nr:hypothetical protein GN958_ATG02354 [Phytophthora infestans]